MCTCRVVLLMNIYVQCIFVHMCVEARHLAIRLLPLLFRASCVFKWNVLTESGLCQFTQTGQKLRSPHTMEPGVLTGVLGIEFQVPLFTSKYFND